MIQIKRFSSLLFTGLAVLCLVLHCLFASAQQSPIRFDHFSTAQGLSHNAVRGIVQDARGFIWVATRAGLNRFDGHRFKIFRQIRTDSSSLASDECGHIISDSSGDLWIATSKGLSLYHAGTESFDNYYAIDKQGAKVGLRVLKLARVGNQLLAATISGLRVVNPKRKSLDTLLSFQPRHPLNTQTVRCILYDSQKRCWIGTADGIWELDLQTGKTKSYPMYEGALPPGSLANMVNCLYEDKMGRLWIGTWSGGLKLFDPGKLRFNTWFPNEELAYNNVNNVVADIAQNDNDNNQSIWMAASFADGGLLRFDINKQTFESFVAKSPIDPFGINPQGVICVYADAQQAIWVGGDQGLFRYDPSKQFFKTIEAGRLKNLDCLSDIVSIYAEPTLNESHVIWISTEGCGFMAYDWQRKQEITMHPFLQQLSLRAAREKLTITCFFRDKRKRLWLGTRKQGAFVFDPSSKNLKQIQYPHWIRKIMQDEEDRTWWVTRSGVVRLDEQDNMQKTFLNDFPGLFDSDIRDLAFDISGNAWAIRACSDRATALVCKIDAKDSVSSYSHPLLSELICQTQQILNQLIVDGNNTIWISSSIGLFKLTISDKLDQAKLYGTGEGLPSNTIFGMAGPYQKALWVGTNNGLCRFNPENPSASQHFSTRAGLLSYNLDHPLFSSADGRVYIPLSEGKFSFFDPLSMEKPNKPPPLYFTSCKVFNKEFYPNGRSIMLADELVLSHKQTNIAIEFADLDYGALQQPLYAYTLDGLNKEWIETSQPLLVYNNLPAGNYRLQVKRLYGHGPTNPASISLRIVVHPPFWRTSLFIVFASLLLLALIIIATSYRIRSIRRHAHLQQARLEAEMKALRAQMNPHFIFNCMNTIDAFILEGKQDEASDILQKFSMLMRRVLENSGSDTVALVEELDLVKLYVELEQVIAGDSFSYTMQTDPRLLHQHYQVPSMIIQPFVENAILHGLRNRTGPGGQLVVALSLETGHIRCTISDNGIGFQAAKQLQGTGVLKRSMGMEVTQKRMDIFSNMHHKRIIARVTEREDGGETGTLVELQFPIIT